MNDLTFLQALRSKLKGGNLRSIHLNVSPGNYATRLHVSDLNQINEGFADRFLETLLSKEKFDFPISFEKIDFSTISNEQQVGLGVLSKRLNTIIIENEDTYKEHGIRTFGFGYPILIKPSESDPTKFIKAPLFIWPLEIVKDPKKVNSWFILRNKVQLKSGKTQEEDFHGVSLNEVLLSYLSAEEKVTISQLKEERLDGNTLKLETLIDECVRVLKSLAEGNDVKTYDQLYEAAKKPLASFKEPSGSEIKIEFNGVFGLFRTQKESIIKDLDTIIENHTDFDDSNLIVEHFTGTSKSSVETDPSQQDIINSLKNNRNKIIQGPPGTGKSQTITAIITNALANDKKCLVVCEKKTALDVIKTKLTELNPELENLIALIEDVQKDRDSVVQTFRRNYAELNYTAFNKDEQYHNLLSLLDSKSINATNQIQNIRTSLYDNKNWTHLVGEYLKLSKKNEYTFLDSFISYKDFAFPADNSELQAIGEVLRNGQKLFNQIGTLDHTLDALHHKVFKSDNFRYLKLELEQICNSIYPQLQENIAQFDDQLTSYLLWLEQRLKDLHAQYSSQISAFLSMAKIGYSEFGSSFYENSRISIFKSTALSKISSRHKKLLVEKAAVISTYKKIELFHGKLSPFEHQFLSTDSLHSLKTLIDDIEDFHHKTQIWIDDKDYHLEDKMAKFSTTHFEEGYVLSEHALSNEHVFNSNYSFLLDKLRFNSKFIQTNSLREKREIAAFLSNEIKLISENLTSFKEYYEWRTFIINVSELQFKIIKAFAASNVSSWEESFKTWYYHWLLAKIESEIRDLPQNDDAINELKKDNAGVSKLQISYILSTWRKKQALTQRRLAVNKFNANSLYNLRGSKGERKNSLRRIIDNDFDLFSVFFPVLLVSPSVASSILPMKMGLYDFVIFDEASQLRIEDTYACILRGKNKIVSGDNQQMPPSNHFQGGTTMLIPADDDVDSESTNTPKEAQNQGYSISDRNIQNKEIALSLAESESLLSFAENTNYEQYMLKVHYRSEHPYLIDFSNHAFYNKRLVPMPEREDYVPIDFIQTNGVYDKQTNYDEAKQVLDILINHIHRNENGTYPSVGVATFNIYQRNLILDEITKAKQTNPEFNLKMSELDGEFFVKNLENIQGDERDIIILSTTFGPNKDGVFKQSFGPIIQKNGHRLLNVIVTRAKKKIYVCTSVPETNFNSYSILLSENKFYERSIFYAYLAYAKAVSTCDDISRQQVLANLSKQKTAIPFFINQSHIGSESPFEEEVYQFLAAKIGENRVIQQFSIAGFRIDMVIKSKYSDKTVMAIECDGAKFHGSYEAYSWDIFRQTQLENHGFIFHRIWSTNWWNNESKEQQKLLKFIEDFDFQDKNANSKVQAEKVKKEQITPISERAITKQKVLSTSIVTVKNPEGKILKVKFTKSQSNQKSVPDKNGIISVYENAPLALSIMGRSKGDICQLGLLEVYYEILSIE